MTENKKCILNLIFFILLEFSLSAQYTDSVAISIQTSMGEIHAVLYPRKAPITCANFLKYADRPDSNSGQFYRTVTPDNQANNNIKIEVIQGGFDPGKIEKGKIKTIPLERTNITGVFHRDGAISMARDDPDSGSTEFFICIGDQPSLDFGGDRNPDGQGFAAFGRVIKGMEIVRKIQMSPADSQVLIPPINILKITRDLGF